MRLILALLFLTLCSSANAETAYRYDQNTKLFMRAEKVPTGKEGELLVGENTTLEAPPSFIPGETIPLWEAKGWSLVPDLRGKPIYSKVDRSVSKVDLNNTVPDGYTLLAPTGEWDEWDEVSGTWVENTTKKEAEAEEIARQREIGQDTSFKTLREKLDGATVTQMRSFVKNLFPNLNDNQQEFLVGLLLLAR